MKTVNEETQGGGMNELRRIRKSLNLTQRELGELIGCKGSMVCMLEKGARQGRIVTWERLEKVLGVDFRRLREPSGDFHGY